MERVRWIDRARGIAILLVVLGHIIGWLDFFVFVIIEFLLAVGLRYLVIYFAKKCRYVNRIFHSI